MIGNGSAGKYNYVSPEQLGMAGGEVTFKSDIYSFGLVLAEAPLGRPLDMSGSQADVVEKRRAVPDIAGVDRSIRPLIQAMLQPLPDERPSSMAAVAEWGESAARPPPAGRASGGEAPARVRGRAAAMLGALIAIVSLAAVGYVFRDDLSQWVGRPSAPTALPRRRPATARGTSRPAAATAALPPLAPAPRASPHGAAAAGGRAKLRRRPRRCRRPRRQRPRLPRAPAGAARPDKRGIGGRAPPGRRSRSSSCLRRRWRRPIGPSCPHFPTTAAKGLRLAADFLPQGLAFKDLGDGKGVIEGTPTHAGASQRISSPPITPAGPRR